MNTDMNADLNVAPKPTRQIPAYLYDRLVYLGIIGSNDIRDTNVGTSNYSEHLIQPWSIWLDYPELTPFDCDIVKRILRTKTYTDKSPNESRIEDYKKIIHICQERIRQLAICELNDMAMDTKINSNEAI